MIVVDCHSDFPWSIQSRPLYGRRGNLRDRWIPEFRAGGIDVQVSAVSVDLAESALASALQQIAVLQEEVELNPDDAAVCVTGAEIRSAVESGRIAFVLALEGASPLGSDPRLVRIFYQLGVRMISFTHFGRSLLADGSGEDATGSRLTRAGVAVLAAMQRLGILMDVSHLSRTGVDHVLELATRPVIASHSCCRALCDHHRNLTDAQIKGIAATGGVVCINAVPAFVGPDQPTIDRMVDHVLHALELAGEERVGIGTDFCYEILADLYASHIPLVNEGIDSRARIEGLWASRHVPAVTECLLRRGLSEPQVRSVMGGNLLRLFDAELGVPAGTHPRIAGNN